MQTLSQAAELVSRELESLLKSRPRVIAAVDGRCGSGKTTFARALGERVGAAVVHTDDYYLPFEKRVSGWETVPAANMDFDRLRREVLEPASRGMTAVTRRYRCMEGTYLPEETIPPRAVILVEGSYSHHPALADLYDVKIFLTCSPQTQEERLRAREGDYYPMFPARWIPLEEGYFQRYRVPESADLVLEIEG